LRSSVNVRDSSRRFRPSAEGLDIGATGLVGQIDEAPVVELLHGYLDRPTGETKEPCEVRDVHLVVGVQDLERPVLGEGESEWFERLVHEDLEAMLEATGCDHDLPARCIATLVTHPMFIPLAGDIDAVVGDIPLHLAPRDVSMGYRQTARTRSVTP
jgi:hypothetical protein